MYTGGTPSNPMGYRIPGSNMELIVREVSALNLGKSALKTTLLFRKSKNMLLMETWITIDPSEHLTLPQVSWRVKCKRQSAGILQTLWAEVFKLTVLRLVEYDISNSTPTYKKTPLLNPNAFGQGQMCPRPPEIHWLSFPQFSCIQVGVGEKNPGDLIWVP